MICEKTKLADFNDNYCGNCGTDIASPKNRNLQKNITMTQRTNITKMNLQRGDKKNG